MVTLNTFGLSGGKDSTALWGWALNDSGYDPKSIRGIFCDTENEYDEVYEQIVFLDKYGQERGAPPVAWLESEGFLALAQRKGRFPSPKVRFCTQFLKIYPSHRYLRLLAAQGYELVAHSGVRRDESTERSLLPEWSSEMLSKEGPAVRVRRPLLDWTIDEVWAAHKRYKLPINPLYFRGRTRVGCKLCIMSSKDDVALTVQHHPETIDLYRQWELQVKEHEGREAGGTEVQLADGSKPPRFSSFFHAETVPPHCRSAKYWDRDGKEWPVATIDDVASWSMTMRGGRQLGFQFMFEADDSHLPCQSGYCE